MLRILIVVGYMTIHLSKFIKKVILLYLNQTAFEEKLKPGFNIRNYLPNFFKGFIYLSERERDRAVGLGRGRERERGREKQTPS